ncbi:acyl-CoA thioesterase [Microbacterium imperiale]|uniref:Acyl-CoA thioesterase 2 n=1 Tax=Microbacterium imperiale TaxID=33884 RepID=A0A9W6HFE5_9MICO|nr:acyl-CoA thioesterase II [Microbacterium imperiale]MBP2419532.1 acyl-CoA thioesterase-2 [Microbacterium imperiale]MDS0198600.1 acyl-CoA thioesterase II [Microbacterium imperiale]BFE39874.1 acyl-CoA thioesterase II [Microbacterium imperiale]GLJ79151.1 acyl-CoA thioesterase II [Microbacterium imperiale]
MAETSGETVPETPAEEADPVAALLRVLDLSSSEARTTEDIFTGESQVMPQGRVFGGQVLAQATMAAMRTVPDERVPHSMHGYFLRPGDSSRNITFSVDRIHDGRSFSTRRTQAFQNGSPIFSMIASFEDEDPGVEHAEPMPEGIPQPEDLPGLEQQLSGLHPLSRRIFSANPIELRHVTAPIYLEPSDPATSRQAVWARSRSPLPDDPTIHRAALAFLSDLTIQEPVLRAHGLAWATPGLKVASLDHAMWWHRFARVDEWLLYVQESPSARGGRGLSTGRIYDRAGTLIASVAQEIMVRVPDGADGAAQRRRA